MTSLLRRLPGAGLLREAWHATQLQGAIAEKKRNERALVLAEENAKLGTLFFQLLIFHFLHSTSETTMEDTFRLKLRSLHT